LRFWYWRNSDLISVFVRKRDIPRTVQLSGGCFILKSCMDPNHDVFVREIQIPEGGEWHGDNGTRETCAPDPWRALGCPCDVRGWGAAGTEAKALYEKRFPDSSPLFGFGDFLLFRLVPREARFVAGFARAHTVDLEELKEAAAVRFSP
jgi:hypothetical protein